MCRLPIYLVYSKPTFAIFYSFFGLQSWGYLWCLSLYLVFIYFKSPNTDFFFVVVIKKNLCFHLISWSLERNIFKMIAYLSNVVDCHVEICAGESNIFAFHFIADMEDVAGEVWVWMRQLALTGWMPSSDCSGWSQVVFLPEEYFVLLQQWWQGVSFVGFSFLKLCVCHWPAFPEKFPKLFYTRKVS